MAVMWPDLPFLMVSAHSTGIAWDEIIPITLIGLTILAGVVLFLLARRFKPLDEEQDSGDGAV